MIVLLPELLSLLGYQRLTAPTLREGYSMGTKVITLILAPKVLASP